MKMGIKVVASSGFNGGFNEFHREKVLRISAGIQQILSYYYYYYYPAGLGSGKGIFVQ